MVLGWWGVEGVSTVDQTHFHFTAAQATKRQPSHRLHTAVPMYEKSWEEQCTSMKDNLAKAQSAMLGNKSSLKTDSLTGEQAALVVQSPVREPLVHVHHPIRNSSRIC